MEEGCRGSGRGHRQLERKRSAGASSESASEEECKGVVFVGWDRRKTGKEGNRSYPPDLPKRAKKNVKNCQKGEEVVVLHHRRPSSHSSTSLLSVSSARKGEGGKGGARQKRKMGA